MRRHAGDVGYTSVRGGIGRGEHDLGVFGVIGNVVAPL